MVITLVTAVLSLTVGSYLHIRIRVFSERNTLLYLQPQSLHKSSVIKCSCSAEQGIRFYKFWWSINFFLRNRCKNEGLLAVNPLMSVCPRVLSFPTGSLETIFMKLRILKCHTNPKTGTFLRSFKSQCWPSGLKKTETERLNFSLFYLRLIKMGVKLKIDTSVYTHYTHYTNYYAMNRPRRRVEI